MFFKSSDEQFPSSIEGSGGYRYGSAGEDPDLNDKPPLSPIKTNFLLGQLKAEYGDKPFAKEHISDLKELWLILEQAKEKGFTQIYYLEIWKPLSKDIFKMAYLDNHFFRLRSISVRNTQVDVIEAYEQKTEGKSVNYFFKTAFFIR
ncbi:MAG: hypothetical protein PVJ09_03545 [Candidatus Woesebacteria bacterium]|jgi:hypothetical protein